jgi:ribosome-associated toxin RatA of RatAB toxin-antitoxin module
MSTKVRTAIEIAGGYDAATVFEKIRVLEEYPLFMPDVRRVRVLEQDEKAGASEWDVDIEGCPLHWLERDHFDARSHIFSFESVEGDFDRFAGRWQVMRTAEGLTVEFEVEYLVGIPVIEDIIGPILKVKMERNTMKMLEHLKAEVEATPPAEHEATWNAGSERALAGNLLAA